MNDNLTLVIMAAGMGSRFGGLKQIEPVGPNGEIIIDYSIYDAIEAGFNKVVFIIKRENYDLFKEVIGSRIEDKIEVEYVFQELSDIPEGYTLPESRIKPLGTAHALRAARNNVNAPFAVITADDFYGRDCFIKIAEFLKNECSEDKYGIVAYDVLNTVSENGTVNRGIMFGSNGKLSRIVECAVEKSGDMFIATPHNGEDQFEVANTTKTTMITYGFHPNIFDILTSEFEIFLNENLDNLEKCEYYIPNVVQKQIDLNKKEIMLINTTASWQGITYKEDIDAVKQAIKTYHEQNIYPNKLW